MKTTHFYLVLALLITSFSTISAQKKGNDEWKLDGDKVISASGQTQAIMIKRKTDFSILSPDGKTEWMYFKFQDYEHPSHYSKANPNGRQIYYELIFTTLNLRTDMLNALSMKKKIVRLLQEEKLVENGVFNEEAAKRMVNIHGTKYTDERNRLQNNGNNINVIINNNK